MQVDVFNKSGQKAGTADLNDSVFAVQPNEDAMHLSVQVFLANQRQGTHKTKLRSEVSGGGKKPWKQKGRGTARSGSSRSPVWVGGGTIHGPKPHTYDLKINKKVSKLARKSALSLRVAENNFTVVEDFGMEKFRTKEIAKVIADMNLGKQSTLIVLPSHDAVILKSASNLPKVHVTVAEDLSAYAILSHKKLLVFKGAIEKIEKVLVN